MLHFWRSLPLEFCLPLLPSVQPFPLAPGTALAARTPAQETQSFAHSLIVSSPALQFIVASGLS